MSIVRLEGILQHYDWGSLTEMARILNREPSGRPEAELWLGSHPKGPARISNEGAPAQDLRSLLAEQPRLLGGGRRELPFLFKVLCAASPLSLQAHPDQDQAAAGFAEEEARGIALDDPARLFKDQRHKPELIFALSDFSALCGFITPQEAADRLELYGVGQDLLPARRLLLASANQEHFPKEYLAEILALRGDELRTVLAALTRGARNRSKRTGQDGRFAELLLKLSQRFGDDPGILAAMTLRFVELRPGEALFLPARTLHSYVHGSGIEVMANSDNVIRGGLTSKHVDRTALMNSLSWETRAVTRVPVETKADQHGASVSRFLSPAEEFSLCLVSVSGGKTVPRRGPSVLLGLSGHVVVHSAGQRHRLGQGDQLFCSALIEYELAGSGQVAVCSPG